MKGQKAMWPRPTIDFHLLQPFKLLSHSTTTTTTTATSNFEPQNPPAQEPIITIHHSPTQNPPTQKPIIPNLINLLTQSLSSILPFANKPVIPVHPSPPQKPLSPKFCHDSGCAVPLFRPYVARVPWHGGVRAFLSQLFPRYGHYCGPNWSSGKDGGSMLWDRRPIDWLDFCCYCHDIGYDTHDQAKLLKADLAFLECLERPRMATKGGAHLALIYRSMCITGLRHILIPYRMQLIRMQSGPSFAEVLSSLVGGRGNAYRQNSE